jgi:hypothetical protein
VVHNNGFESGLAGWSVFGNHTQSVVQTGGAASGGRCLHVRAEGDGDTGPNSIRTAISGLSVGQTVTIRAKVRWLTGWPQVLFRLHGNWMEMSADMRPPRNLGTPGLPNSRLVANAGPAITEVIHHPILPQSGDAVTVTARVADPDEVAIVWLRYRVDPGGSLTRVVMRDDGTNGDARANDGIYTGRIPAQSNGRRVPSTCRPWTGTVRPSPPSSRRCIPRRNASCAGAIPCRAAISPITTSGPPRPRTAPSAASTAWTTAGGTPRWCTGTGG